MRLQEKRAVEFQSMRPRWASLARETRLVAGEAVGVATRGGELGRLTLVMMLKSTHVAELDDFADLGRL